MNSETINSTIDTPPSTDEVEIQEQEVTMDATTVSQSLLPSTKILKTARDQFFEDLQHEKKMNRWSAKCLLCKKSKRVMDKIGVTSNFTRHVRQYHEQQYQEWVHQSKEIYSTSQINKITNHFSRKNGSADPDRAFYGPNHSRQVELSMAIVSDLIISLGLPLSIVERPTFINFMRKVDPKFTIASRRTITRKTIPSLYDKMNDHLLNFCSKASFLSLALDVWTDRRLRSFFAVTGMIIIFKLF